MDAKIEKLKEKLRKYDTADLLGMISIHFMTFASDGDDFAIQSKKCCRGKGVYD